MNELTNYEKMKIIINDFYNWKYDLGIIMSLEGFYNFLKARELLDMKKVDDYIKKKGGV